jgi:hypothetical protein
MLVSTVGRGLFINLNFEPSIRGNPCRIIEDMLLQRRINGGAAGLAGSALEMTSPASRSPRSH